MKEMIQEFIFTFRAWRRDECSETVMIRSISEGLLAVMERIDAMEQPPARVEYAGTWAPRIPEAPGIEAARTALLEYAGDTDCDPESMAGFADGLIAACVMDVTKTITPQIERAAMIKALVWWCSDCKSGGAGRCEYCRMRDALTRLENGGEL